MRLLLSLLLVINSCFGISLDKFHVCTVGTYEHPNLAKLRESCVKNNIDLEVIGLNMPYLGHGTKLNYFKEYIEKFGDDEIVMFIDAFDVLVIAEKKSILVRFLSMNAPFIMAAETNCAPYAELAPLYPESPTPFRYINTGSYIGYVKNIKEWLNHINPDYYQCDQGLTTQDFINTPPEERRFILDYKCQLFLPLFGVQDEWVKIDKENQELYNKITKTYPCVVHANGASFRIWDKVYTFLVKPKKKKW